jgi:hypothetical protein
MVDRQDRGSLAGLQHPRNARPTDSERLGDGRGVEALDLVQSERRSALRKNCGDEARYCREANRQDTLGLATMTNVTEAPMSRTQSPNQSEFFEDSSVLDQSVDPPPIRPADLKNDAFPSWRPSLNNLDPLALFSGLEPIAFARYLITFSIGAAVALAWQSHSGASREVDSLKTALSLDRDAVQQSIDRIATRIIISQEEMTHTIERGVDRLAAGQERAMSAISDLQTVEQYFLDRVSTPPPPATGPKLVLRPSQAPTALTPARNP